MLPNVNLKEDLNKINSGLSNFSVLHINVQSLFNKTDELQIALTDKHFDILCVSEHWLEYGNLEQISLPGYRLVSSFCREGKNKHGGVAIFASTNMTLEPVDVSGYCKSVHIELCAAEVGGRNCLLLALYRSSSNGDLAIFKDCILNVIDYYLNRYMFIIVIGDFNLDFEAKSDYVQDLVNMFLMYGIKHCIRVPTRITPTTKSTLDNILTNISHADIDSGIFDVNISDHLGVFVTVKGHTDSCLSRSCKKSLKRNLTNTNFSKFTDSLRSEDWLALFNHNMNSCQLTDRFMNQFMHIVFLMCILLRKIILSGSPMSLEK